MKKFSKVVTITASVILAVSLVVGIITVGMFGLDFSKYGSYYLGKNNKLSNFSDQFQDISYIEADIAFGTVNVVQGDSYSIDAKNVPEGTLSCSVVDGNRLVIKQRLIANHKFFGFSISDLGWNFGLLSNPHQVITITVEPEFMDKFVLKTNYGDTYVEGVNSREAKFDVGLGSFEFKNSEITKDLKVYVGSGDSEISNIKIEDGKFDIGLGEFEFTDSISTGILDINVGTGDAEIKNITSEDFKLDSGLGTVKIFDTLISENAKINAGTGDVVYTGKLECDSSFDVGMGSCKLRLDGSADDYNLDLDVGLGTSRVNGNKLIGKLNSKNAVYDMKVDVGTGDFTLDFKEE